MAEQKEKIHVLSKKDLEKHRREKARIDHILSNHRKNVALSKNAKLANRPNISAVSAKSLTAESSKEYDADIDCWSVVFGGEVTMTVGGGM